MYAKDFSVIAQSRTISGEAAIYRLPSLEYELGEHLSLGHTPLHGTHDSMPMGQSFELDLIPASGYLLPETVELVYENDLLGAPADSYDKLTGHVSISSTSIVSGGNMILRAEAPAASFTIHYYYEILGQEQPGHKTQTVTYGESFTPWEWNGEDAEGNPMPGYTFTWSWYLASGVISPTAPATMPARDIAVIGRYTPRDYNLVVRH